MGCSQTRLSRGAVRQEVDRNYEAFKVLLPTLLGKHRGKFALIRGGRVVEFFDTFRDAYAAGQLLYGDGLFSYQEVTDRVIDLGWFSHVER